MSKSLQRGILFSICVALVLALSLTLVFFAGGGDKNILSAPQGQVSATAQNTTSYTHGSYIGRQYTPQGTVHKITASGTNGGATFKSAITANNGDIVLEADIDLGSWGFSSSTFNYNIYGNGRTITFSGPSTGNAFTVSYTNNSSPNWGAIAGTLTGGIYDLNLRMTGSQVTIGISGNSTINVGVMVGLLSGGTIENCTVTTVDSNGTRIAALKSSSGNNWTSVGGVAGKIASGTVRNITASINGWLEAGVCNSSGGVNSKNASVAGNIAGYIEGGNVTMDNIKVTNNSSYASVMNTQYASNLGMLASTNCNITVTNFYNDYKTSTSNNFSCDSNGGSVTFTHYIEDGGIFGSDTYVGTCVITNYFVSPNAITSVSNSSGQNSRNGVSSTVTIPSGMNVYFDPTASNTANSLAVVFTGSNPTGPYIYTIMGANNTEISDKGTNENGNIVFRNLPTAVSNWGGNNGTFTATWKTTLSLTDPQHKQDDLQPWEHGYTATKTTTGTEISSGSKFEELFSRTGSIETTDTSTYYLTKDIVITGFTGKQFAGTLDGNGHTIYIAASDTALSGAGDATSGFAVGGLVGVLTGTIKNVRVVIDADITVGLDSNKKGRIGGVVGRLNGGTLDNMQVVIPSDVTISHDTGSHDSGMGGVVGQALGASVIKNVTVQMDGTLAPVGTWTFVSALVAEVPTKNGTPTINMDNIIVRGSGTFAAKASQGTSSGEPPYVSVLANFNNKQNYEIITLDGLIYDFTPTISGDGSSAFGIFVNNNSGGNPDQYGAYVTDSNLFIMQGREYTPTKTGTQHAGNTYIPLDSTLRTINNTVEGLTGSSVAAYFMPGTGLVRLQVHSDLWSDERLTISGVKVDGKPIMSSLATVGDSSSDRYFSVDKSTLSGLGDAVQVSLFSNVTDPTVQGLTYTGSPLDIVIDMSYNGVPLTAGDYSLSKLTASGGNALVQDGKPLNAGEYSVTVTLNNPDHWFGISGSGEASKTANVTFTVSPKNVTMQDPGDSMTAVYGTKYWIKSNNNVWGLDENLFFAEEVGNVEYTATVTRTDDGEGYASASGWLKAGSYRVALTINDSNYAINGNASVIYPLTITPVGLSYTLTVENSVAAVYDGNVRTISGTPQGGDGIISAAYEGSAGTAGDSVTAAVSVTYGGVAAQIQNAGDYVLGVALSGDDAENYTAVLTASWTDGGAIANNTVTVEKYPFTLQWGFDSQVALEYGDDITDDLIAETELFEAAAIPYNGGSFTGKISFNVVSATYDGGTPYAPGVAVGTSVTFEVKPVLPDVLDENNYNINVTASGSVTKMVAQRTLTVNYDAFDMTAVYGDSISNEWLTEQYKEEIAANVSNIYNNEEVNFKVILYYRTFGGAYQEISDFSALEMGVTYMAAVVVDGNNNYTIPNSLSNGYDFNLTARTLTISGITWAEDGFDGVYDGQAHALKAVLAEGSSLKEGDDGVLKLSVESITNVSDSGSVTVSVASKYAAEYNLTGTTEFTVTLNKKTLNILPYTSANFLDHDVESLYAHLTNAESGLINGVVEGDTLTFGGTWATEPTTVKIGEKSYVAAGSYTLNISVTDSNYKFDNNAMSVTVNELDIGSEEVAVTWKESLTYNAKEQSVSLASVTVNGVALPVEWFNLTDNTGTDADTYTATVAASNANITGSADAEFTVSPASVTVTAGKEAKLGALHGEKATAETERFYESDFITLSPQPEETFTLSSALTFTVKNSSGTVSPVEGKYTLAPGTYTVTYTINNIEGANYTLTAYGELTTTLIVEEGALKLTITGWNNTSLTYNGMAQLPTPVFADSAEIGEKIEEGALVYEVTAKEGTLTGSDAINAGSYTVTVSVAAGFEQKYELAEGSQNSTDFTIEQLEVVLKWEAEDDLVYNGKEHTATATVNNKVDDDDVKVSVQRLSGNNNTDVTPDGFHYVAIDLTGDDAGNYKLPENKQSEAFKVTPAQKEITWNFVEHPTIVYGDSVEDVKKLVNIGALNGTIPGVTGTLTFTVSVGNYSASTNAGTEVTFDVSYTLPEGAKANNYEITVKAADGNNKLTVQRANITVTVSVEGKTYDGLAVTPSVTVKFGERELAANEYGTVTYTYAIKGGDTLDAAPADASDSAYTVTASVAESTNFNTATSAAVEFKIGRKTLTQGTWSDVDGLTYNGDPAAPVFKPVGVFDGDNVSVGYTIEGDNATDGQAINAGSYTVTAKLEGVDAGNYEFDGVVNVEEFTIARKELTVVKDSTLVVDFGVIGETTNTYKEQIASWDIDKNKVITGFFGNDTYTLGDIRTDEAEQVVYTGGKLNAGSYYVSYTVGDNYTIGSGGQTGLIPLTVKKLSYEISLTYTIDGDVQSGWDGNISFEHDAPITLTFTDNALEITFNDGSNHTHVVTVEYDGDGTLPNVTFTLGGITINGSYSTATISSVQSMNVTAQITPDDYTNHTFTGTTSFNFAVKRNTRVEANEGYFKDDLRIPSEYTGESISVAGIDKTKAFTVTLGGIAQSGAEVSAKLSIAATLNGKPTDSICDAGDYVITATYTTDNDEVVTGTYEFTVAQAKLSFELESAPAIVYGEMSADVMPEALKAFTATGVNGKSVTGAFAITVGLNENIYSNADFVKAGSYNFTITFTPDDVNYAELVYNSADDGVKLTVEKKAITPSAISYGEVTSEGTTLTLNYAGKSAYDGNLAIATDDILSSDAGSDVVEFISEKDYSAANEEGYTLEDVKIGDAGDGGNYTLDLNGWKVVVLKKTIEVTVNADSYTYTGSAIKLTASSEEIVGEDDVTFTVSGENVNVVDQTVTNAGTYDLTVTLGGEQGGNYEVAGEPSVTIGKAGVEIVWTNETELESAVYNGQPYEVKVDVRFNGQSVGSASIKYTSDEVTVTEAVNAGSYTAEATFAGTDNFNATTASYDFTIAKMVLNGEWKVASDMNMTYDGTSKEGYATWTWTTEPVNESDVTVGYKYELGGAIVDDVIDAGNYNVYAVFTGNTGNYDIKSDIFELTVARRAVTVKWSESVSFIYNGAEQAPAATAQNVVEGDSLTLTVTGAQKDVGTYTATVEAASVTGNYVLAEDATVKFTIAPKSIGVEWGNTAFTYNGLAQKPTATATGLVEGDSLTLTVTGEQTNANAEGETYTATVKAFEQGNYKLESTSTKAFTIAKADLTVTPASLEIRERETDVMQAFAEGADLAEAFAGRISVSGVSGTVSYTVTIAGEDNYDDDGLLTVGAHTFTIDAGGNYNAASVSVTVIATPVVTVIASVEGELVYNGSAFEISYALKEGAPVDVSMDDITVTASVETIVNAGEYEVTFTVTGSNEDYDYVVQDASGNAALTFTIARRGLDVAEVAEAVYGDLQVSGTLVTGTYTAFVAYNDEEIELLVNVKAAALSRAAAEYLDAGEYEVTIALADENGNFSLNGATLNAETEKMEVQSTLDVAPKTVTVGYTPSSGVYDAKGISITLDKFEDMLIEGDDPAVNIYINDAPYTGKVVLDAGEYTVRYESADPNYAFAPVSATFTVEQKHVTPNFDLNTGSGSLQITGGGKLEIEEGEETDIVAAIDNFMQSSGVPEEDMSISVSGDLKLEDLATWAPGTYTVTVTLSGNHSGSMQFTVEVSEKIELPPPVAPELPETPVEAGSGNDWVLPLVIAIVALIDLALLVAIGVAAKKRA